MKPINEIAEELELKEIIPYGQKFAKINHILVDSLPERECKLILTTAITPTKAGEGKTTTTIALGQAFAKMGKKAVIALREPSLGPVFGVKGGGAGGGKCRIEPMEEINLHFTGDIHAITSANNLLSAMIDNHIFQGNELNIDKVEWMRVLDMNDRALRRILINAGGKPSKGTYKTGFEITAASEVMAVLCLSKDLNDLKRRLGNLIIGYDNAGKTLMAKDLNAQGSMAVLLKDAINPNLVQTVEGSPAIVHGGPFANIAHGCNSIIATKLALKLSDYVITEGGFGADLGAEKFLDVKCRVANLKPDAVVLVATVRAIKEHGQGDLEKGFFNVVQHINIIKNFGLPFVIGINRFKDDTDDEIQTLRTFCENEGAKVEMHTGFVDGGAGAVDLAKAVIDTIENSTNNFNFIYPDEMSIKEKIEAVASKVYGAIGVDYTDNAEEKIKLYSEDYGNYPIIMAKTPLSLSDSKKAGGCATDFRITVKNLVVKNGAEFIVVYLGKIMTMPGLSKEPAALGIDLIDGEIDGLF
jgi:formate--tetrahydrofolate ligase